MPKNFTSYAIGFPTPLSYSTLTPTACLTFVRQIAHTIGVAWGDSNMSVCVVS